MDQSSCVDTLATGLSLVAAMMTSYAQCISAAEPQAGMDADGDAAGDVALPREGLLMLSQPAASSA